METVQKGNWDRSIRCGSPRKGEWAAELGKQVMAGRGEGAGGGGVKQDQHCLVVFTQGPARPAILLWAISTCSVNSLYLCCPEALGLLTSIIRMVHTHLEHLYSQLPHGSDCFDTYSVSQANRSLFLPFVCKMDCGCTPQPLSMPEPCFVLSTPLLKCQPSLQCISRRGTLYLNWLANDNNHQWSKTLL